MLKRTVTDGIVVAVAILVGGCSAGAGDSNEPSVFSRDGGTDGEAACVSGGGADGGCTPTRPQGTPPEECPSGRYAGGDDFRGQGVCLPEYPRLTDWECPEGWLEKPGFVDDEGAEDVPEGMEQFHYCEPPPLPESCPAGKMPILGETECQPIGLECPGGGSRFHDESTIRSRAPEFGGDVLYVDADATGSATGERSAPYQSISKALGAASDGDLLALAPTTFEASIDVLSSVAIVGSCAAGSRIVAQSGSSSSTGSVVRLASGGIRISDLGITGLRHGMTAVSNSGESVSVHSTRIRRTSEFGFMASGQVDVKLEKVVVRETQPRQSDDKLGRGMQFQRGASGTLKHVVLERNHVVGLVTGGSETTIERAEGLIVRKTRGRAADGLGGWGVGVESGSTVTLRGALLDSNRTYGLFAADGGTLENSSDLVVRDTRPRASDGHFGLGIWLRRGASASFQRVLLRGNRAKGLYVTGSGTRIEEATDLLIRRTRSDLEFETRGHGIIVRGGAAISAERVVLDDNRDVGIGVNGEETVLEELVDVVVRDTRVQVSKERDLGLGVGVQNGATASFRRMLLEGNRTTGLVVLSEASLADSSDIVVRDTHSKPSTGRAGYGMSVQTGGSVSVRRLLLAGNHAAGLFGVTEKTKIAPIVDLVVQNTQPTSEGQALGRGITLRGGASASFRRALVTANRTHGLYLKNDAELRETRGLVIRDTKHRDFDGGYGDGVYVSGGTFRATGTVVTDNARNGLVFSRAANSRLGEARVTNNGVGITEQFENDVEFENVHVEGNEQDNRRCTQQCYEEPEEADRVDPSFGE